MTYALTTEAELPGVYQVYCHCCHEAIGTMKMDTILKAIHLKGPILCPECRTHKCDFCGEIKQYSLGVVALNDYPGGSRICPACFSDKRFKRNPEWEKGISLIDEIYLADKKLEAIKMRLSCLSILP